MNKTLIVSTDGQAVLRSHDNGATWRRLTINQELEYDDCVRCLLADPRDPQALFAGTEKGLFHSSDCGANWTRIDSALNDYTIWKLAVHPDHPDIMYAGTGSPSLAILFRSRDGGKTWSRTGLEMPPKCAGVSRPRMLALAVDPDDPLGVWAGVEEGGLFRSRDGGDSWQRVDTDWAPSRGNSDLHDIVVFPGEPKTILALVVNGIYKSVDDGVTWTRMDAKETWGLYYTRVLRRRPQSGELILGIGDGTPGSTGVILRSEDRGRTWRETPLPTQPNSCFWAIGTNVADPDFILAGTKFGHLYRSEDGGLSWRKEWREFSEITDIVWLPAVPGAEADDHAHHP